MAESRSERLNKILEQYRGQNLLLAIAVDDDMTILAKGTDDDAVAVVRVATETGRRFMLVDSPPAEDEPHEILIDGE